MYKNKHRYTHCHVNVIDGHTMYNIGTTYIYTSMQAHTFWTVRSDFSTNLWSSWSSGVLFNIANISRGNLVMRCMGSNRNDSMLKFWHRLCFSNLLRYSRNIVFLSLEQTQNIDSYMSVLWRHTYVYMNMYIVLMYVTHRHSCSSLVW